VVKVGLSSPPTYPQLYFLYKITKSLKNKKTLSQLNINSLKYCKKLKFSNNKINYHKNPEYYIWHILQDH